MYSKITRRGVVIFTCVLLLSRVLHAFWGKNLIRNQTKSISYALLSLHVWLAIHEIWSYIFFLSSSPQFITFFPPLHSSNDHIYSFDSNCPFLHSKSIFPWSACLLIKTNIHLLAVFSPWKIHFKKVMNWRFIKVKARRGRCFSL